MPPTKTASGREYEAWAADRALEMGLKIVSRNFRFGRLEGDLLLWDPLRRRYLLWEVRGRVTEDFLPSLVLSARKKNHLRRLALWVCQRTRQTVAVQLVQLLGVPPEIECRVFDVEL